MFYILFLLLAIFGQLYLGFCLHLIGTLTPDVNYVPACELAKIEEKKCRVALESTKVHQRTRLYNISKVNAEVHKLTEWKVQYGLAGNLQDYEESSSPSVSTTEKRVVSFAHLPNTFYIKGFDMISEEPENILIHHFAVMFCKNLGEGYTVNQDSLIEHSSNERLACVDLMAPYGIAWGNEPKHLNTSEINVKFSLPKDVGLMVGTKSNYKFAGVSVHFSSSHGLVPRNAMRNSIILLDVTNQPPKHYMGMIYANVYYNIPTNEMALIVPGGQKVYTVGTSCVATISEPLQLFSYGTHTHRLGTSASVYIHSPQNNVTTRILLDTNPNGENKVENFENELTLYPEDIVISTCTYDTSNSGDVKLGGTSDTEMCDFVLNFYTKSNDKDEHIIKCSDSVVSDPQLWDRILNTKGALVYH